jgi:hypothetical protein
MYTKLSAADKLIYRRPDKFSKQFIYPWIIPPGYNYYFVGCRTKIVKWVNIYKKKCSCSPGFIVNSLSFCFIASHSDWYISAIYSISNVLFFKQLIWWLIWVAKYHKKSFSFTGIEIGVILLVTKRYIKGLYIKV